MHLHHEHVPPGVDAGVDRAQLAMYAFSLVVVRRPTDGRFLLVQEFANQGYWLPGGGVDAGETLEAAAIRETREEAGVAIKLTGVLRLEYSAWQEAHGGGVRLRAIFLGEPLDPAALPKTLPDYESAGAVRRACAVCTRVCLCNLWCSCVQVRRG